MVRSTTTNPQVPKTRHGGKPVHTQRDLTVSFRRKWYKKVLPKDIGFADGCETTDWAEEIERDIENDKFEMALTRAELDDMMEARYYKPAKKNRPPKGIFNSKKASATVIKTQQPMPEWERELLGEVVEEPLTPAEKHELLSHVGAPSPAHKPRRQKSSDENPYNKPRFREGVGMGPYRPVDPVGQGGPVRSGRVRKVS